MKTMRWSSLFLVSLSLCAATAPERIEGDESRGSIDPNAPEMAWWRESMRSRDDRLRWWREARFGMFVHWGVYSSMGGEWQGKKLTSGYTEHIQRRLKIPCAEYRSQVAAAFNPTAFDADAWIRAAKDAGMGYFIITAKHHDGFAMYDSKVSDFNIVKATPFGRDPMRELRDACRKHGLRFGFYYSHAFDWGEENGPGNDWDYSNPGGDKLIGGADWWKKVPEFLPRAKKYVDEKSIPQLLELVRNYDPDIFWFDTPHKLPPWENLRIFKAVREACPRVVINGRILRGLGDYDSTSDQPAEFVYRERDWEGIPTTNDSYGWSPFDRTHKPAGHFIGLLIKATARGGNTLMNIGPMGDGRIDPLDTEILGGIGRWWKINGESIRGAGATPLPVQAWGESTAKGNTLYLQVFRWPSDGRLVVGGLGVPVTRAYLLADAARAPLAVKRLGASDCVIEVPARAPDPEVSVVAIECGAPQQSGASRLLQPSFGEETLRSFDAALSGGKLRFAAGKRRNPYVENWTEAGDCVTWKLRLAEASRYEVLLSYDADKAGARFEVEIGRQRLHGKVEKGVALLQATGRASLPAGDFTLTVRPAEPFSGEFMRLRGVILRTVVE